MPLASIESAVEDACSASRSSRGVGRSCFLGFESACEAKYVERSTHRRLGPRAEDGKLNVQVNDRWAHLVHGPPVPPSLHLTFLIRQPSHACTGPRSARSLTVQEEFGLIAIRVAKVAWGREASCDRERSNNEAISLHRFISNGNMKKGAGPELRDHTARHQYTSRP